MVEKGGERLRSKGQKWDCDKSGLDKKAIQERSGNCEIEILMVGKSQVEFHVPPEDGSDYRAVNEQDIIIRGLSPTALRKIQTIISNFPSLPDDPVQKAQMIFAAIDGIVPIVEVAEDVEEEANFIPEARALIDSDEWGRWTTVVARILTEGAKDPSEMRVRLNEEMRAILMNIDDNKDLLIEVGSFFTTYLPPLQLAIGKDWKTLRNLEKYGQEMLDRIRETAEPDKVIGTAVDAIRVLLQRPLHQLPGELVELAQRMETDDLECIKYKGHTAYVKKTRAQTTGLATAILPEGAHPSTEVISIEIPTKGKVYYFDLQTGEHLLTY